MIHFEKKILIVLIGPTAVGKTRVAIELAQWLRTDIISIDSRQFYKEMSIGTAKPTDKERKTVPHHLVDFLSVTSPYDVKSFEQDALLSVEQVFGQHDYAVASGGSGLYAKVLCEGIDDMPQANEAIRQKLGLRYEKEGLEALINDLKKKDPTYYQQVDLKNHRRVLRALEVIECSGQPYSLYREKDQSVQRPFKIIKIGLNREREELYNRINLRVDLMIDKGLIDEAKRLYPFRNTKALQTVGYQEVFPYLDGQYDLEEAIRLIKRNSRRYAKRQLTWFRKDADIQWFSASQPLSTLREELQAYLKPILGI